jgi:hypothetical protein
VAESCAECGMYARRSVHHPLAHVGCIGCNSPVARLFLSKTIPREPGGGPASWHPGRFNDASCLPLTSHGATVMWASCAGRRWSATSEAATEISPTFPSVYHHDEKGIQNEHKCMGIAATASVLITKYCPEGGCRVPGGAGHGDRGEAEAFWVRQSWGAADRRPNI